MGQANYSSARAGLIGLTRPSPAGSAPGDHLNAAAPAFVLTS
jgi:hypothetical protein